MNLPVPPLPKPLLRGWSHGVAAFIAVAGLVSLILITRHDPAKLASMVVYGIGLVLLFGVSATYHIFNWPPRAKDWLRRADHATIFVFIAASYTPLVFNILGGWWRIGVLVAIWIMALAGLWAPLRSSASHALRWRASIWPWGGSRWSRWCH
jgi:hemolysin III